MRVSTKQYDSGYHYWAHLCEATVNGAMILRCFTADEELGYVERYKADYPHVHKYDDGTLQTERIYGTVKIICNLYFKKLIWKRDHLSVLNEIYQWENE